MDQEAQQPVPPQPAAQAPLPPTNFELSISAVFKNCWDYFTQNLGVFIGLYAASIALTFAVIIPVFIAMFSGVETDSAGNVTNADDFNIGTLYAAILIGGIGVIAVTARIVAAMYAASLHIMQDGARPTFGEAWKLGGPHFTRVLLVTLVLALEVAIGFILFIIPGILVLVVDLA